MNRAEPGADQQAIVLYDAGCNLCQGAVSFIRRHERPGRFRFVPLGSPEADSLLATQGCGCDTIHLVDEAGHHDRSTAVLRIAAQMGRPWSALRLLRVLPVGFRDAVYDFVARRRLTWFGRA